MGFVSKETSPTVSLTHHPQESVRHAKKNSTWTFSKDALQFAQLQHIQKNMLRVIITEGKAYWTLDNVFYSATAINGRVDEDTVKPLDFENMTKEELTKMLSILDDLKQGVELNDSGSTGDQGI